MSLCAGTRGPLDRFARQIDGDIGVKRDRFRSKRESHRHNIRAMEPDNSQFALDFADFNSQNSLSDSTWGEQHHSIAKSRPYFGGSSWSSEFHNTTKHYPEDPIVLNTFNHASKESPGQPDPRNQHYRTSSVVPQRLSIQCPPSSSVSKSILGCYPSIRRPVGQIPVSQQLSDAALEVLDWDIEFNLLTSLNPTTQEVLVALPPSIDEHAPEFDLKSPRSEVAPLQDKIDGIDDSVRAQGPHRIDVASDFSISQSFPFSEENLFKESTNAFSEGLEIYRNDGNLSVATLAFEAACQKDASDSFSWRMLGTVLSENERDATAIIALTKASELDPKDATSLMKLATAYANEGDIAKTHETLKLWLDLTFPADRVECGVTESEDHLRAQEQVRGAFVEQACSLQEAGSYSLDIQAGLGVMFYSIQQYEKAADCFLSAIQADQSGLQLLDARPLDLHLLWNRYGACMGNLGRFDAGIEAYEMALAIKPCYVRARFNLGVLHFNKNDPLLGARNTLQAIFAQQTRASKRGGHRGLNFSGEEFSREEPTVMVQHLKSCLGLLGLWPDSEVMDYQMIDKVLAKLEKTGE